MNRSPIFLAAVFLCSHFALLAPLSAAAQCAPDTLLQTIPNPAPGMNVRFGYSVAVDGNLLVAGEPNDDTGATDAGRVYIFNATTGALLRTLNNPAPEASDQFGFSVAISGNLAVIGARGDNAGATYAGTAYVFDATTGALISTLNNPVPAGGDQFGFSVAISGNVAVVGAYWDDAVGGNAGTAYIFNATTGDLVATLNNPTPGVNDNFGNSVAVDGNTVVVGADSDSLLAASSGTAYVFDATTGELVTTLNNPAPAAADLFGWSVAISGNLAVVGARVDDVGGFNPGAAYVFNATTGALISTLSNPAPASDDQFGVSVAISGNVAVVGAYLDDAGATDAGTAYVFNATTGALLSTLSNPDPAWTDEFGFSVAVSGNVAVVGAFQDDTGATDAGSVYTFTCDVPCAPDTLQQTVANPAPAASDFLGNAVAISGGSAVIGAYRDDAGAADAGAAYLVNAATGAVTATLSNPSPTAGDEFGFAVGISGNLAVVGAHLDDAGASNSGTAYVFNANGALVTILNNPTPASGDRFGVSVGISGSLAIVGASRDDTGASNAGSAYIFNATNGALVATLANPAPAADDLFGDAVAISGNLALVSAVAADAGATDAGVAYVFNATTGALLATLTNPDPTAGDFFGSSAAIDGNLAIVGANGDNAGGVKAGATYVFVPTTGALVATLAHPSPVLNDSFGDSVAISGEVAVVGGSLVDAGASSAGSAYVFNATTGALAATIAAPAPVSGDQFGGAVAVSGTVVLVGATGIDTGATDAGSAYLFACAPPTPTPTESPTASPTETPTESPTPSPTDTPCDGRATGDFDCSGCTDINDFLFLLDYWNTVSPIGGNPIGLDEFLGLLDNWFLGPNC